MTVAAARVALLTREYPPEVYGGAGVHVEYLARELARLVEVEVHCFGRSRSSPLVAASYGHWETLDGPAPHLGALRVVSTDLAMAAGVEHAALVHSHTWYANLAGHLARLMYGVPHVVTTHSLEPLRPWKAEQLGGGYAVSSFCERVALESADAVVAVSEGMARDVLACYPAIDPGRVTVIHNGIDPDEYQPDGGTHLLERLGIDPLRPSVVFVGRITHQKGLAHLLAAARDIDGQAQLVLCAGAPDTEEIGDETGRLVEELTATRGGVVWIREHLDRPEVVQILSHAAVFVCPSVYEPFGLVNLEAMACEAPVVATATGGIPEIVVDGRTGLLVPFTAGSDGGPDDPDEFASAIAARVNALLSDRDLARRLGREGRRRVVERFTWRRVAERTIALYQDLLACG